MKIPYEDQQRVYLAFRTLFAGQNGQIRQSRAIGRILQINGRTNSPIVLALGYDKVLSILKDLLERQIFTTDVAAERAFPTLHFPSRKQKKQDGACHAIATTERAKPLSQVEAPDVAAMSSKDAEKLRVETAQSGQDTDLPVEMTNSNAPVESCQRCVPKTTKRIQVPSLYPAQLPFAVQHTILTRSQKLLEECCYHFTKEYATSLPTGKDWDCAEAVELNEWTSTIIHLPGTFPTGRLNVRDPNVEKTLLAVNGLRHSAVHRTRLSTAETIEIIGAAVDFAETLVDPVRASQLEEIHKELQSQLKFQGLKKDGLENQLKEKLEEIDRQREELAKQERDAISNMIIEDKQILQTVGCLLTKRIRTIFDHDGERNEVAQPASLEYFTDTGLETTEKDELEEDSTESAISHETYKGKTPESGLCEDEIPDDTNDEWARTTYKAPSWQLKFPFFGSANNNIPPVEDSIETPILHAQYSADAVESQAEPYQSEAIPDELEPGLYEPGSIEDEGRPEAYGPEDTGVVLDEVEDASPGYDVHDYPAEPVLSADEHPIIECLSAKSKPDKVRVGDSGVASPFLGKEDVAAEPAPVAIQPQIPEAEGVSLTNIIRDILKNQEIGTAYLTTKKNKGKKKKSPGASDAAITTISNLVSEGLRREIDKGTFSDLIFQQTKAF